MICGLRCERVGKCDEEPLFDTARQDRFLPLLPTGAFRDRPSMNRYQQRPRTLCNFPPPPISVALGACPAGMKETRECHAFTRYRRPCHGLYHVAGLPHQAHWPAAAGGCANEACASKSQLHETWDKGNIVRHLHPITRTMFFFLLDDLAPAGNSLLASASAAIVGGTSLDTPIEDVIILEALANEEVTEELA
jgi:hypothetical protein